MQAGSALCDMRAVGGRTSDGAEAVYRMALLMAEPTTDQSAVADACGTKVLPRGQPCVTTALRPAASLYATRPPFYAWGA